MLEKQSGDRMDKKIYIIFLHLKKTKKFRKAKNDNKKTRGVFGNNI